MRPRAFTLVECLAVVALMALAVATLAVGIAPATGESRLREARSMVLDLDARARVLSGGGEPVVLAVAGGSVRVRVGTDPAPVLERGLPASVEAALLAPESRGVLPEVCIDSRGRGADYVLSLRLGGRRTETLVAGLTGYAFAARGEGR
ncbi:MAG: type II secretion system protein [Phycisphaerales bacterium]|nr:type II secretion system protein [Phycisphaerales bacterium]